MLCLVAVVYADAADVAGDKDLAAALISGKIWSMSPGEVWRHFLQEESVRPINGDILITGKERLAANTAEPEQMLTSRTFWFWLNADTQQTWATPWVSATFRTESQRLEVFKPHAEARLKRLSVMLYRAGSDSRPESPEEYKTSCLSQVEKLCGGKPLEQGEKTDAAGRSIRTWLWSKEKTAILLEIAEVDSEPDYVRLSFAADIKDLYYARTATEAPPTRDELLAKVEKNAHEHRLPTYPIYTGKDEPYAPGWFTTLCYYGYHDIDNFSERRPKSDYPGKYIEIQLRSSSKGKEIHSLFERACRRDSSLAMLQPDKAEEAHAVARYPEEMNKWWKKLTTYIRAGVPVIYGGREGFVFTACHEDLRYRYLNNSRYEEMSIYGSYLRPNAVYVILPPKLSAPENGK